jgi:hypothetical protein
MSEMRPGKGNESILPCIINITSKDSKSYIIIHYFKGMIQNPA